MSARWAVPERAGLNPSNQRFQRDNPCYSHNKIEYSLNENRPLADDLRQACDERGPQGDKQQDQANSDQFAR